MRLFKEHWSQPKQMPEIIPTLKEIVTYIGNVPDQEINLDNPKGSYKGFGHKKKIPLPFDYGEYPNLINPSDNLGWDIIIVPSSSKNDKQLIPVGHVQYNASRPDKKGNDKIIIAPEGQYTFRDKEIINDFFDPVGRFKPVKWY